MSVDPYVYPGTNILVNKLGITDAAKLEVAERTLTFDETADLRSEGVTGRFDVQHLRDIHKRIFGDVYGWAGEFRTIQIWKGGTEFAAPDSIQERLEALFQGLRDVDYFRDLPKDGTANGLAEVMAELNLIHPFREGNGRTQRAFIGQLALNAGYDLDFTRMSENDMRNASMAANRGNCNLMRYLFREALSDAGCGKGPVTIKEAEPEKKRAFGFLRPSSGRKMTLAELIRPKSATAQLMRTAYDGDHTTDKGPDGPDR